MTHVSDSDEELDREVLRKMSDQQREYRKRCGLDGHKPNDNELWLGRSEVEPQPVWCRCGSYLWKPIPRSDVDHHRDTTALTYFAQKPDIPDAEVL